MSGDNGELLPEPSEETVEMKDLIIAARRGESGIEILINSGDRAELEIALMRLTHQVFGVFNAMSYQAMQKGKSKIIKSGGIMDFVRKKHK